MILEVALSSLWKDAWIGTWSWFIKELRASLTFPHSRREWRLEGGEEAAFILLNRVESSGHWKAFLVVVF